MSEYNDEHPISLEEALRLLAEVHTQDDAQTGFRVNMGAIPASFQQRYYVEAWGVVRVHLGMQTEPSQRG